MATSEFGSMILLNKETLHLISVDPILKFEIVLCESLESKIDCSVFIPCFKKNILNWALKETNHRYTSDDDRCHFTVVYSFSALSISGEKS